jgi:hypothetical protein
LQLEGSLDGLKTDLKLGAEAAVSVQKWAREYEISETVLRVRFQKMTTKTVEEFASTTFVVVDHIQEALERATKRFQSPETVKSSPDFGRLLTLDGEKFRYVAWDGRKVFLVSAESGHVFTYTGCDKIFSKLSALRSLMAA